jgi:ABC-type multidrug transport system ATPase subunit
VCLRVCVCVCVVCRSVLTALCHSGSGKSTSINIATYRLAPDAGTVRCNGASINDSSVHYYATAQLGCCLQTNALFAHLTGTQAHVTVVVVVMTTLSARAFEAVRVGATASECAHRRVHRAVGARARSR